jgi:membrane protein implicated in regulation of membrane protease activity
MLGQVGTVITELAPRGVVRLEDGNWTAESDNDTVIPTGGKIIVIGINDLILTVIPFDEMG